MILLFLLAVVTFMLFPGLVAACLSAGERMSMRPIGLWCVVFVTLAVVWSVVLPG